jgi:hypothetical protein
MPEIKSKTKDQNIKNQILKSLDKIQYGEVIITIHNSKVVQIEHREKQRFKA